ncbi:ABC transporter substrate-binding protein [Terrarubrum flagellatum]|uniref:ABC transporter substrate-binding protein n=1 Tax=Terrirubrum flagellatum TaxID=2895980 RepID=UPI0031455878
MSLKTPDRRLVIAGLAASAAALPARAEAPKPYAVTDDLVAAAKKEGTVTFYTSTDVAVAEKIAAAFEAKYAIKVKVERSGSERVFQRIMQEYGSNIFNADVIETSDAVNFLVLKSKQWIQQALPEEVAKDWPKEAKDPDGYFAAYRAHCSVMGYNTRQVKTEDTPKSYQDLLAAKWKGRIVKAHPGYSGTIMTATDVLSNLLGWDYFEKLGQQRVMQVQSSTEPPKKLAQGERSIQADGNEYNMFILKETGVPVEVIYPTEGTVITVGHGAMLKTPPHPNAAKLFYSFMYDKETQQLLSDIGGLRSFHPGVKEKEDRKPLSQIKLLWSDPAKLEPRVEEIKKKYEQFFGV